MASAGGSSEKVCILNGRARVSCGSHFQIIIIMVLQCQSYSLEHENFPILVNTVRSPAPFSNKVLLTRRQTGGREGLTGVRARGDLEPALEPPYQGPRISIDEQWKFREHLLSEIILIEPAIVSGA